MNNKLSLLVNFVAVDKMTGAMRNIVGLGRDGSKSIKGLSAEARKLDAQMRSLKREMTGDPFGLKLLVKREEELASSIAAVNTQLERQKRLSAINADQRVMQARADDLKSRGTDNMAGGAMMAAPLAFAAKAAADFNSGMVDIQQKAGLTNQAADALSNRIVALAQAAKQMPEDMRAGLDVLLAKGMRLDIAEQAIGPAARLATAYKVELPDAAGAAFASINNLKVAAGDAGRIFDVMAAAGNAGGFEVRDMARAFPSLTAQMQALGETGVPAVADLSAALQVAMNTAGNADEAANNIQNLLGKINDPATVSAFKKNFGVDLPAAMKKLTDEGYSSMEAIAMVTQQATGGDTTKLGFAFGDHQARMGLLAIMQNMDQYRKIRADALNSGGTVDEAFNQRAARDATTQWKAFIGTASSVGIVLGSTLLPVITQVVGHLGTAATAVAQWAQAHPEAAGAIMQLIAGIAAFKIGLGAIQFGFGAVLGPIGQFISIFRMIGGVAALTNPVFLVIAALAGAAYLIYSNWETISGFFQQTWASVTGVFTRNWTTIRNIMLGAVVIFMPLVAAAIYVGSIIYRNWDKIKDGAMSMVRFIGGIVEPFIKPFVEIGSYIAGLAGWFFTCGADIVSGLINGILSMTGSVIMAIANLAESVGAKFAEVLGIKSPSRLMMAMGGHVTDGLAIGISRGSTAPVQAMSRLSTDVTGAGQISLTPIGGAAGGTGPRRNGPGAAVGAGVSIAGSSGAGPVTINVYGAQGQDVRQLARAVQRELTHLDAVRGRSAYSETA